MYDPAGETTWPDTGQSSPVLLYMQVHLEVMNLVALSCTIGHKSTFAPSCTPFSVSLNKFKDGH